MGCINWAWKIQGLKSNEKVLLLAIADRADKESGVCVSPLVRLCRDAGGWTRQQTNRVIKRLEAYGLLRTNLRNPGTEDLSRMYTVLITVDPETWRPAIGEGRTKASRRYYVNLNEFNLQLHSKLLQALRDAVPGTGYQLYEEWFSALHVIEISKGRMVCRIPSKDFAEPIFKHRAIVLKCASELQAGIKNLRFLWDNPRKSKA